MSTWARAASTAARIRARGYLIVGVRYDDAPFGSVDEEGDLVGFDVDLAHEFAYRWLGDSNAVRFEQVTNASASERILSGRVDLVIGALTHTQNGARDMDYSQAYYYDGLALLARTGGTLTSTLTINGPGDLDGVAVAVVQGSGAETPLLRAAGEAEPVLIDYPDYFSAVGGLEGGVVGAPDDERGQIVKAYVVLRPGYSGDQAATKVLQEFVKATIAPYKYPRAIEYVTALPRTQTGKLQRFELRRIAADSTSQKLAS